VDKSLDPLLRAELAALDAGARQRRLRALSFATAACATRRAGR
jgi:hypothetical protein